MAAPTAIVSTFAVGDFQVQPVSEAEMAAINPNPPVLTKQQFHDFHDKIDRSPNQGPKGECWEWLGYCNRSGYGIFYVRYRHCRASRVSYWLSYGVWPRLFVCHTCDNRKCCRPSHLFLGTHRDNMIDCFKKGRNPRMQPGYRHSNWSRDSINTLLTNSDMVEIERLCREEKLSHRTVAERYGLNYGSIPRIIRRVSGGL